MRLLVFFAGVVAPMVTLGLERSSKSREPWLHVSSDEIGRYSMACDDDGLHEALAGHFA